MRPSHPTVRRLNAEWQELAGTAVPSSWRAEPALAGASDLAGILASVRGDPDAVLGALLRLGGTAHRVVLQAMLGCMVLAAGRDRRHDLDDYLAELWLGIAAYPLARRPTRIAANLALDVRKRVRRASVPPVDVARLVLVTPAQAGAGAALLLARARRIAVIDAEAERALRLVYGEGLDTRRAASVLGVTPAALRQRCHRALRRLAATIPDAKELLA